MGKLKLITYIFILFSLFSCSEKKKYSIKELSQFSYGKKDSIIKKSRLNDSVYVVKGIIDTKINYSGKLLKRNNKLLKTGFWKYSFDNENYVEVEYLNVFEENSINQLKYYIDNNLVFGKFYFLSKRNDSLIIQYYNLLMTEKNCLHKARVTINDLNNSLIVNKEIQLNQKGKFLQNEIYIGKRTNKIIIIGSLTSDCFSINDKKEQETSKSDLFFKDTIR